MLEVSIDPHRSILAMTDLAKGVGRVIDALSCQILHNETGDQFLTTDCPVCYFDPLVREDVARPYTVSPPHGPIELLFPISSKLLLRGYTSFGSRDFRRLDLRRSDEIRRYNTIVAKFGYRMILSGSYSNFALFSAHHESSPIAKTSVHRSGRGEMLLFEHMFGKRPRKPKWRGDRDFGYRDAMIGHRIRSHRSFIQTPSDACKFVDAQFAGSHYALISGRALLRDTERLRLILLTLQLT